MKPLLLTTLALLLASLAPLHAADEPKPNRLFILVDDLAMGDLAKTKPDLVVKAEQLMRRARGNDPKWPLSENSRPKAAKKGSTKKAAP